MADTILWSLWSVWYLPLLVAVWIDPVKANLHLREFLDTTGILSGAGQGLDRAPCETPAMKAGLLSIPKKYQSDDSFSQLYEDSLTTSRWNLLTCRRITGESKSILEVCHQSDYGCDRHLGSRSINQSSSLQSFASNLCTTQLQSNIHHCSELGI